MLTISQDDKEQVEPDSDYEEGQTSEPRSSKEQQEEDGPVNPPLPAGEVPPPLPNEAPPLPNEVPPVRSAPQPQDDGWEPLWDENAQAYYFYNRFSGLSQWDNPRVPDAPAQPGPPGVDQSESSASPAPRPHGGYNPAIHGDYDPTASYALEAAAAEQGSNLVQAVDPAAAYGATGQFNRFTGRWQAANVTPDNYNDDAKSKRQMNAFFDVDAAANVHQGKSLKAERSGMKLTKQELKAFKEKRREKKEEKRRAWLRD